MHSSKGTKSEKQRNINKYKFRKIEEHRLSYKVSLLTYKNKNVLANVGNNQQKYITDQIKFLFFFVILLVQSSKRLSKRSIGQGGHYGLKEGNTEQKFQMGNQNKFVIFISSFLLCPVFSLNTYLHNCRLIQLSKLTKINYITVFSIEIDSHNNYYRSTL